MGENAAELLGCSLSERVSGLVPRVPAEMGAVSRNQEIKKKSGKRLNVCLILAESTINIGDRRAGLEADGRGTRASCFLSRKGG